MLKISQGNSGGNVVSLVLAGRIVGPWVEELRRACDSVLQAGGSLRLVMAEVEFMDARGTALLTGLSRQGVAFVNAPPFVIAQLGTFER